MGRNTKKEVPSKTPEWSSQRRGPGGSVLLSVAGAAGRGPARGPDQGRPGLRAGAHACFTPTPAACRPSSLVLTAFPVPSVGR